MAEFLQQLDVLLLLWIQSFRQEWLTPFWIGITRLGDHGWFWIGAAGLLLVFRKTRGTGAAVLAALALGAMITNLWLKPWVARIRPYEAVEGLTRLIAAPADYSFPSGHSCAAFAAAAVCWRQFSGKYRWMVLILASLVAFSRLYLGVHYPSDVLGGILVGTGSGWIVQRFLDRRDGQTARTGE